MGGAPGHRGGRARRAPWPAGPELAGATPTEATADRFLNRDRWEREEGEGNASPTLERSRKHPSYCAMAGGGKLLRRARPER